MISAAELPSFNGRTDVLSAKEWFGKLAGLGITFHADDDVSEIEELDANAREIVDDVVSRFRLASHSWPDPDFLYDLAGTGRFPMERDYAAMGFVLDAVIPAASRTGYVSMPGQAFPTVIVEEGSQFFAIQPCVDRGRKRLSEVTEFKVIPVIGARFGGPTYIDVGGATLDKERGMTVSSLSEIENALSELAGFGMQTGGPHH